MTLTRTLIRFRAAVSLLVLVVVWQAVASAQIVPAKFFPDIPAILQGFWSMLQSGELLSADSLTLSRAAVGLAAASALGIALALLSAIFPSFDKGFRPIADLIQPIPPAALVPMAIFTLGLGWKLYAFIVILVTVWPPYLNGRAALAAVPQEQIRTGRMLGMTDGQILLQIKLPAALPEIFSGIRYAATISLIAVVVAEMLSGRNGLGFLLIRKSFAIRIPEVYALMFTTALNGVILNLAVNLARRAVTGWHVKQMGYVA